MSIGIGTTSRSTLGVEASQTLTQSMGLVSGEKKTINLMVLALREQLESQIEQLDQVENLYILSKETVNGFNQMILNMDRGIPELIDEINEKVDDLGAAYNRRIQQDYLSDLVWQLQSETVNIGVCNGIQTDVRYQHWEVVKDPDTYRTANYYGLKYYRRPKNKDYESNFKQEIKVGIIGVGSSIITITDDIGSNNIGIGDYITDDLEFPFVFNLQDLPRVIGIGTSSFLGVSTTVVGTVVGISSEILHTGPGIVTDFVSIGDIITNPGIVTENTRVVGFGTTSISLTVLDGSGTFGINTVTVTTIIMDKDSITGITTGFFDFGSEEDVATLQLDKSAVNGGITTNFFIIQGQPEDNDELLDDTKSGDSPVQLGIMKSDDQLGYGHTIVIVNNGSELQSSSWLEGGEDEPFVGAGNSAYYLGRSEWPTFFLAGITSYATLGQKVTVHLCPSEVGVNTGYTVTSPNLPSESIRNQLDQAIVDAQNALDAVISQNIPEIEKRIGISSVPREIRDEKETLAWGFQAGIANTKATIAKLKRQLDVLENTDYSEYYD
jgi:hypothetical protein